jgi:hypothetical protein
VLLNDWTFWKRPGVLLRTTFIPLIAKKDMPSGIISTMKHNSDSQIIEISVQNVRLCDMILPSS